MKVEDSVRTTRLAKRILEHFLQYPESGDSVVGIARWGLEDAPLPTPMEVVEEALEMLLRLGFLEQRVAPGMRSIYRLQQRDRGGADLWLASLDEWEAKE